MVHHDTLLDIGLIGFGAHTRTALVPALRQAGFQPTAVVTAHPETARHAARWLGAGTQAFGSIAEFWKGYHGAAVAIATTAEHQPELALQALQRGFHVFVEKPAAMDHSRCAAVVETARAHQRVLAVGLQKRFAPTVLALRCWLNQPAFEPIAHVYLRFGVGAIGDDHQLLWLVGIHAVDTLNFLLGDSPLQLVDARKTTCRDRCSLVARFVHPLGTLADLHLTDAHSFSMPAEYIEVTGYEHRACLENMEHLSVYRNTYSVPGQPPTPGNEHYCWCPGHSVQNDTNNSLVFNGFVDQFRDFSRRIQQHLIESPHLPGIVHSHALIAAWQDRI